MGRNQSRREKGKGSEKECAERSKTSARGIKMDLPTREQAEAYFDDFHVPDNFKQHCFLVNRIAVFLAEELKATGEHIDLDLVDILSLLHDLFKPAALEKLTTDAKFKCYPTPKQITFWEEMKQKYKA